MKKMASNRCSILLIFTLFLFSFPFSSAHGDPLFFERTDYGVGEWPESVATGDFDGDMALDLAVANRQGLNVSILLGAGDGTFQEAVHYSTGRAPLSIATGDLDGDMILDLAVSCNGNIYNPGYVSILLGTGDGTFQVAANYDAADGNNSVAIGDFDGDMIPDLAVAYINSWVSYYWGGVSILLGAGDGAFQEAVHYGADNLPLSVAIGDFDGDMILDLATANAGYFPYPAGVSILLGAGDGTFQEAAHYGADEDPRSVATGDFNGDMILDLATANTLSDDVSILLGAGDGTFRRAAHYGVGDGPRFVATGDFDGNMTLDLATANVWSDNVSILINNEPCFIGIVMK
ncbi:FG-GAP repeat domain-containing protein [Thermodesulfobacteriota bacterium]